MVRRTVPAVESELSPYCAATIEQQSVENILFTIVYSAYHFKDSKYPKSVACRAVVVAAPPPPPFGVSWITKRNGTPWITERNKISESRNGMIGLLLYMYSSIHFAVVILLVWYVPHIGLGESEGSWVANFQMFLVLIQFIYAKRFYVFMKVFVVCFCYVTCRSVNLYWFSHKCK